MVSGGMSDENVVPMIPKVPDLPYEQMLDWFRNLSTAQLKWMWDNEIGEVHCDEIHCVMNERGEGSYVAV